jgi:hypothetical protein
LPFPGCHDSFRRAALWILPAISYFASFRHYADASHFRHDFLLRLSILMQRHFIDYFISPDAMLPLPPLLTFSLSDMPLMPLFADFS